MHTEIISSTLQLLHISITVSYRGIDTPTSSDSDMRISCKQPTLYTLSDVKLGIRFAAHDVVTNSVL